MSAGPALYYHVPLELAALRRMGITQSMSRRGQQGHACTGPHTRSPCYIIASQCPQHQANWHVNLHSHLAAVSQHEQAQAVAED